MDGLTGEGPEAPEASLLEGGERRALLSQIMPRGLFARALVILITPIVLVQAIVTYVFIDRHLDTITQRLAQAVANDVALIIEELQESDADPAARQKVLSRARRLLELDPRLVAGRVPDAAPTGFLVHRTIADAVRRRTGRPVHVAWSIPNEWTELRLPHEGGVLSVLVPQRRLFSYTATLVVLWMIGSAAVLLAVAVLFLRNQVRPIRRLALAADRLGRGLDVPGFRIQGADEVRQAARAFLVMRARLDRQIQQRTEMLAGVSHDLRAPLTRMKLELALLGEGEDIQALKDDVAEMERMIDGYLAFARGEGGEPPAEVDLGQLAAQVVADARRQGLNVEMAPSPLLRLTVKADALRRCLVNLVQNAARHGSRVVVTPARHGRDVEVAVDDDGPGIPSEEREAVFRPFFRRDASRTPGEGGVGLGLTIARDVARAHGGDLTLEDSPLGGLRALVRLPG